MRKLMLAAAGAVALMVPAAASAQGWGGGDYYHGSDYGRGYGSYFNGYPQFRDAERHIRSEIRDGQSNGWLDDDQARSFYQRLRWIRQREQREFNEHSWSLPYWDQQQIKQSLDRLDQAVDASRNDDEDNQGQGGWYDRR